MGRMTNMANNRMWLIHKPSNLGIKLGKRLAEGWYAPPETSELKRFYDYILHHYPIENQDDFMLVMEEEYIERGLNGCSYNWWYTDKLIDNFRVFEFELKEKSN